MLTIVIENYITNANFVLLFGVMLLYLLISADFIDSTWNFVPNSGILLSNFLQASFLILRWISSKHFPLSNLYESLLFLSWVLTSFVIFFNTKGNKFAFSFQKETKVKTQPNFNSKLRVKKKSFDSYLSTIITPLILLINTFATFSLPLELKQSNSLVPALKSNWLIMHVTLMMLSYGALLVGCLLAIAYLIVPFFSKSTSLIKEPLEKTINLSSSFYDPILLTEDKGLKLLNSNLTLSELGSSEQRSTLSLTKNTQDEQNQTFANTKAKANVFKYLNETNDEILQILDNLSYRILGFGFPLLTIGILSGAVWANKSWGSYWQWDPKETWALITWLVFAIYLHTRISYGWTGRESALIASFGFIIIWICYLGVNLLGSGLHSYGFFN